ncbi:MAG: hypothetical protein VXZ16_02110 [Bacteroidota bacterium]|nr:hypothetical protein [Bacteroidota bacterium]
MTTSSPPRSPTPESMAWDELEGHFTREVAREDLRDARFESCTFVASDLSNMRTFGLGLQHVTFRGCKLVGFDFSSCNALGFQAHMENCIADAANVEATDFRNVTWKGGRAHGADFRTATGWRIRPEENRVKGAKFRRDDLLGLVEGWDLDLS